MCLLRHLQATFLDRLCQDALKEGVRFVRNRLARLMAFITYPLLAQAIFLHLDLTPSAIPRCMGSSESSSSCA